MIADAIGRYVTNYVIPASRRPRPRLRHVPVTLPVRRARAAPRVPLVDPLEGCGMAMDEKCVFVAYRMVATVLAILLWPLYRYPDVRSFILAHSRGLGDALLIEARHRHCAACPHLVIHGAQEYCGGADNGRGCGCGHHRLARLAWKLKLKAWSCPQGHFGAER